MKITTVETTMLALTLGDLVEILGADTVIDTIPISRLSGDAMSSRGSEVHVTLHLKLPLPQVVAMIDDCQRRAACS